MNTRLDESINAELIEFLGDDFSNMSQEKQSDFFNLYKKSRKTEVIYIYWFFNLHYAYVGKWRAFVLFIITFGGFCIWWLLDLFRLNTILREYNNNKAIQLFKNFDEQPLKKDKKYENDGKR